jgi:hypothetical protein
MTLRRLLKSMIALTLAAGLVSAPLAATAFAKPDASLSGEMHAMDMQATDMQAMAGDMTCCPDEGKAGDCASCPLLALCMLSISIPLPAEAAALVTRDPLREAFSARDDAWVPGLGAHPPDHPPRTRI